MGGFGSGRWTWHSKRQTVEDALAIRAGTLKEAFNRGQAWRGSIWWTSSRTGERTSSIGYEFWPAEAEGGTVRAGRLRLRYTTKRHAGNVDSDYWIDLETTPCNFGGVRWWFLCPMVRGGRPCRRRCGKLYCPGHALYFGCRECYDLTYTSCQESHKFDAMFAALAADTGFTPDQVKRALTNRWR